MAILCATVALTGTTLCDMEIGQEQNGRSLRPLMASIARTTQQNDGERESFTRGEIIFASTTKKHVTFSCCAHASVGAGQLFLYLEDISARFAANFYPNPTMSWKVSEFGDVMRARAFKMAGSMATHTHVGTDRITLAR
eukprot:TRINITY_DN1164_c0_g1_i3.p1 TRINITY_DN1164_c0_g1~~TRINITY_DN1164_c0_g1_i3.p1  ORF type:complete len:139 (-),score=28.58 TRINITY_DN1164_c0_g1_i3:307-723(-)